jgi:hypothetical protein
MLNIGAAEPVETGVGTSCGSGAPGAPWAMSAAVLGVESEVEGTAPLRRYQPGLVVSVPGAAIDGGGTPKGALGGPALARKTAVVPLSGPPPPENP